MSEQNCYQAIRGMYDILPPQTNIWQWLEGILAEVVQQYGYQQIRLPLLEQASLYTQSIGTETDIVIKEMYHLIDKNGDKLALRPEGTAGCVRAGLQHALFHHQQQRLWYQGPMFRHERPQHGRQRQFHQFGVEAYGIDDAEIDAEIILLSRRIFKCLKIDRLSLQLNTLGTADERDEYIAKLKEFLNDHITQLDTDCQRRLHTNPLRILDSKNPQVQRLLADAPILTDMLDTRSAAHFARLKDLLDDNEIDYVLNPKLVRGLDYYQKTVFEWTSDDLGAQETVCAGGRYDNLTERFGGPKVPSIGFAIGLERLLMLLTEDQKIQTNYSPDLYLIALEDNAKRPLLVLSETIRDHLPMLNCLMDCGQGRIKQRFKRADKSNAQLALILGEDELCSNNITIKWLRNNLPQVTIATNSLIRWLTERLNDIKK